MAAIECDSSIRPIWKHNGGNLPKNARTLENSVILIKIVESNAGMYKCIGADDDGMSFQELSEFIVSCELYNYIDLIM